MTGVVLPIWTPAAGWLLICCIAILIDSALTRRRHRRRSVATASAAEHTLQLEGDMRQVIASKPSLNEALQARITGDRTRV